MSLDDGQARLAQASKDLIAAWKSTTDHWHDQASERFAKEYLPQLESEVRLMVAGMAQMDQMIQRARRDCSDEC